MKKLFASFVLSAALLAAASSSVTASYSQPLPNAECDDGRFVIYINPQGVSGKVAVRVDNSVNGWNGANPLPGDRVNNNFTGSAYIINDPEIGRWYHWWIHPIDVNGNFGPAKGGSVYCLVQTPQNLRARYEYPYLYFEWDGVKGTTFYGLRYDDTQRSPGSYNPADSNSGDGLDDGVTKTVYRKQVGRGRTFTFWVHAIDQNGTFSAPSKTFTITTQ